jgi:uncharacterized membrane protein
MGFESAGFQNIPSLLGRLIRLDLTVFDDVRDDPAATGPAIAVVVVASFLAGLGTWLWGVVEDVPDKGEIFVKATILGSIFQVALWLLWVYIVAMILSRLLGAGADMNRLIRTMGLAFAPMAISLLILLSVLSIPFAAIAIGATFLLTNAAIASATDAPADRAALANLVGFAAFAIVLGILSNVAEWQEGGGLAPGIFFFNLAR